jgi:hypothetical protein
MEMCTIVYIQLLAAISMKLVIGNNNTLKDLLCGSQPGES